MEKRWLNKKNGKKKRMKKIYRRPQIEIVNCQIECPLLTGSDDALQGNVIGTDGSTPVEGGTIEDGGTEDGVAGAKDFGF